MFARLVIPAKLLFNTTYRTENNTMTFLKGIMQLFVKHHRNLNKSNNNINIYKWAINYLCRLNQIFYGHPLSLHHVVSQRHRYDTGRLADTLG
jgi:hypothetical protein